MNQFEMLRQLQRTCDRLESTRVPEGENPYDLAWETEALRMAIKQLSRLHSVSRKKKRVLDQTKGPTTV